MICTQGAWAGDGVAGGETLVKGTVKAAHTLYCLFSLQPVTKGRQ